MLPVIVRAHLKSWTSRVNPPSRSAQTFRTWTAASTTSGPMPSPPMAAILYIRMCSSWFPRSVSEAATLASDSINSSGCRARGSRTARSSREPTTASGSSLPELQVRTHLPPRRDRLHAWKGHSMGYAIAHVPDDLVQLPDQRFGLHIIEFEVRHTPDYGVVSSASPRRPWSYLNRSSSATLSCHDLKAKSRPGEVSLAHKSALAFMTSSKAAFSAARSASL